jgi:hypothetical protein
MTHFVVSGAQKAEVADYDTKSSITEKGGNILFVHEKICRKSYFDVYMQNVIIDYYSVYQLYSLEFFKPMGLYH